MLHAGQEIDAMAEEGRIVHCQGTGKLRRIESHLCVPGKVVAIKARIVGTCQKGETDVGTVFHRRILQRFATCHRSCCSPIVCIEGCEALAAITALAYSEHIEAIGVNIAIHHALTDKLLESILLGQMPPAIVFAFVRYLRYEIDGRAILESQSQLYAVLPFVVLRSRTVDIQKERILAVRSHALLTIIIWHYGIRLKTSRNVPRTVLGKLQVFRFHELFFLQTLVGLAPCSPNHLLIAGDVLTLYRKLKLGVGRLILRECLTVSFLQYCLLRFQRFREISIHHCLQLL